MAQDLEPLVIDSNWLPCYVVLGLIPVVFVCVATYSVWQDRRTRAKYDIEAIKTTYARYWSSCQDPADSRQTPNGPARPRVYIPTLPVNRVGPKTSTGFPAPAPSTVSRHGNVGNPTVARLLEHRPPQYPQMMEPMAPRSPAPPAWTGVDRAPGNHGGGQYPQAGGHGPWIKGTSTDYEGVFI